MAHIKCRYSVPHCLRNCGEVIDHFTPFGFCDGIEPCPFPNSHYTRPINAKSNCINPKCQDLRWCDKEFEKTVKRYEWSEHLEIGGWLTVCGMKISEYDIEYLEIDGRVLIEEGNRL